MVSRKVITKLIISIVYAVVKHPVCLRSIRDRLEAQVGKNASSSATSAGRRRAGVVESDAPYASVNAVLADLALIFDNALLYNGAKHNIYRDALGLEALLLGRLEDLFQEAGLKCPCYERKSAAAAASTSAGEESRDAVEDEPSSASSTT